MIDMDNHLYSSSTDDCSFSEYFRGDHSSHIFKCTDIYFGSFLENFNECKIIIIIICENV